MVDACREKVEVGSRFSLKGFTVLARPSLHLELVFFLSPVHISRCPGAASLDMWIPVIHPGGAGSEQLVQVDDWDGLPPVAEGAELWHEEGFVLLFAQQREHVLHQLAQPAVPVERQRGGGDKPEAVACRCFLLLKWTTSKISSCFSLFGHVRAGKHAACCQRWWICS